MGQRPSSNRYPDKAATIWEMSFSKLENESPEAFALLNFYSFLDAGAIPASLLPSQADNLPQPLREISSEPLSFHNAIIALQKYSLIGLRSPGCYFMHRPVQAAVRDRLGEDRSRWAKIAVETVNERFTYEKDNQNTWKSSEYAPHTLRVIHHAYRRCPEALIPLADLCAKVGLFYMDRARFDDAKANLEKAIVIAEELGHLAKNSNAIAEILLSEGKLDDALYHAKWALAVDEKTRGTIHPDVARDANTIAMVLIDKCDLEGARAYADRAEDIDENNDVDKKGRPRHPSSLARDKSTIAAVLKEQGKLDDAFNYARQALKIIEEFYTRDYPAVAPIAINIAEILHAKGNLKGALTYAERAFNIYHKAYGTEDHPNVATVYTHYAGIWHGEGNLEAALTKAQRAYEIDRKVFGALHPCVARDADIIAAILKDMGKVNLPEAKKYAEMARDIDEKIYGPYHQAVATRAINIAGILHAMGKPEALDNAKQALAIDEKIYGPLHHSVAKDKDSLAAILHGTGKPADALKIAEEALAIDEKVYGDEHPSIADIKINIAGILKDGTAYGRAFHHAREALKIDERIYEADHPKLARDANAAAWILKDAKHFKKAQEFAEKALRINKSRYGITHRRVAENENLLRWIQEDKIRWETEVFNNGIWVINKQRSFIQEDPFEVLTNGKSKGMTKTLAFAKRVPDTSRFPQVLVINSSGYLRLKAGADPLPPEPPLRFGQSLVLGPAISGTSTSFKDKTLFFHPQLQCVDIDTSLLNQDGTGKMQIKITSSQLNHRPVERALTNHILDLTWTLTLEESKDLTTTLRVEGTFEFIEDVIPDSQQTEDFESVRLLQISTMFIDNDKHDVDCLRLHTDRGPVTLSYNPGLANQLLPKDPRFLDQAAPIFDSIHEDHTGLPNENTPSYRIKIDSATEPMEGSIMVRAFFKATQDTNDDNLGVWVFKKMPQTIKKGTRGNINYTLTASTTVPMT